MATLLFRFCLHASQSLRLLLTSSFRPSRQFISAMGATILSLVSLPHLGHRGCCSLFVLATEATLLSFVSEITVKESLSFVKTIVVLVPPPLVASALPWSPYVPPSSSRCCCGALLNLGLSTPWSHPSPLSLMPCVLPLGTLGCQVPPLG